MVNTLYFIELSNSLNTKVLKPFGKLTPLLVYNLDVVMEQMSIFRSMLPDVKPFFAVKSAPFIDIINRLHVLGCGFDLASKNEFELLLKSGIDFSNCLFTNPINHVSHIDRYIQYDLRTFVFDNYHDLKKYKNYKDDCQLLLRLEMRNNETKMDLSKKFGCPLEDAIYLLQEAFDMGIHIRGLSFHVGSNVPSSQKYLDAIDKCIEIINKQSLFKLDVIDIGGGFPVLTNNNKEEIRRFFGPIQKAVNDLKGVTFLAEPGRFFSAPAGTLHLKVIGKTYKNNRYWYYLDDGVYGTLSGKIFDYARYPISVSSNSGELVDSVLAGPTCDSFDIIEENIRLPILEIGDSIQIHNIGAYSFSSSSEFNGFEKCRMVSIEGSKKEDEIHV